MKYLIIILSIITIGSIIIGYFVDLEYSEQLIGSGVIGLFVIVFPLFIFHRWKDRSFKDYMLTKENLDKMREYKDNEK